MRYFKITGNSGSQIEYIKVSDDSIPKLKSEIALIEELTEEAYEEEINPKNSSWDLFMPTI